MPCTRWKSCGVADGSCGGGVCSVDSGWAGGEVVAASTGELFGCFASRTLIRSSRSRSCCCNCLICSTSWAIVAWSLGLAFCAQMEGETNRNATRAEEVRTVILVVRTSPVLDRTKHTRRHPLMCKCLNAMQPSGGAARSEEQKNNEGGAP